MQITDIQLPPESAMISHDRTGPISKYLVDGCLIFTRECRDPVAVEVEGSDGDPRGDHLRLIQRDGGAHVGGVGVIPPDAAVEKIKAGATDRSRDKRHPSVDLLMVITP